MRSFAAVTASLFLLTIASPLFSKGQYPATKEEATCKDYDVFVLRHLEKDPAESKDPSLSAEGKANAQRLSQLSVLQSVKHGFYTPFKRTYETLQFFDISKSVYEPGQVEKLASDIKKEHCGESVVIVGHSNTVPRIIKAFGGGFNVSYAGQSLQKEPSIKLSEADYGSIFRITYHNERLHQQLYRVDQTSIKKFSD
jgi:broad specificity phosphatase PhoE